MRIDELAQMIDHTNVNQGATAADIAKLCNEASKYGFHAVCVNPCHVKCAKDINKNLKIAAVVGFPFNYADPSKKMEDADIALKYGASELDMVWDLDAFRKSKYTRVERDIEHIVKMAKKCGPVAVKVIVETCYLSKDDIKLACRLVAGGGADYIKTSTGFAEKGADAKHIRIMSHAIKHNNLGIKIKAAGYIDSCEKAIEMVNAGASRIGCSKSVKIMEEAQKILK